MNPASVKLFPVFDPIYQDRTWLHLLGTSEADEFSKRNLKDIEIFRELIAVLHKRACAAERHLVIRDYSYIDFIGTPFISDPPRRLVVLTALPPSVSTVSVALVRHPIDQWVSLCKHEQVKAVLKPGSFCDAFAAFLESFGTKRIYKYETFVQNPHGELRAICDDLALEFDPSFIRRFHEFNQVTGDFTRLDETISAPREKVLPPELIAEFHASPSFRYILRTTGYTESSPDSAARSPKVSPGIPFEVS
jgi:hypothetical protein